MPDTPDANAGNASPANATPRSSAQRPAAGATAAGAARGSAGGAGNSGGESFRDDVAARIAVHMLVQMAIWEQSPVNTVPIRLSCEAAERIDDIAITTRGGRLLVQAKGTKLDVPPNATERETDSPFVKAIEQLVAQQSNSQQQHRPLDPSTDRFVLAYKDATQEVERLKLIALRVTAEIIADSEFEGRPKLLRGLKDEAAFKRFWFVVEDIQGRAPTWREVTQLLQLIQFWELRPGITTRIDVDPNNVLVSVLDDEDTRSAAIEVISRHMMEVGAERKSIDADGLRHLLRQKNIPLRGAPDTRRDVDRIVRATALYTEALRARCPRPFGSHSPRSETATVKLACENGPVVAVGDRGMGKSTVLLAIADELRAAGAQTIVVDLRQASGDAFAVAGGAFAQPLKRILETYPDPQPGFLIIDALEETRSDRALEKSVVALIEAAIPRWRVIATARTSAMGSPDWKRLFAGSPWTPTEERFLKDVRNVRLGALSHDELNAALANAPQELRLAVDNSAEFRAFVSVPENLSMVADLPPALLTQTDATAYLKVAADAYWTSRVTYTNALAREHAMVQLVTRLKNSGSTTVVIQELIDAGVAPQTLQDLEHDGVLTRVSGKLSLRHEALTDFIWAIVT